MLVRPRYVYPLTQSIRCRECGKVFRDMDLATYHAEKSGHDDFEESAEEIKPLTEEEKKEKLAQCTLSSLTQCVRRWRRNGPPNRCRKPRNAGRTS